MMVARRNDAAVRLVPPVRHPRRLTMRSELRCLIKRQGRSVGPIVADSRMEERV